MRIGFIGAGGIAGNYRNSLRKIEGAEVVAVCDVNPDTLAKVAEADGAAAYPDHRQLLAHDGLDAVFVCIPPFAHSTQVQEAAERGLPVFVAKPVALTAAVAVRTADAIDAAGVINQSGYMWRSGDAVLKARELLGERRLGLGAAQCLVNAAPAAWWRCFAQSGGQVVEQATHLVDLMRLFLGEVVEVTATGHTGLQPDIVDFEDCTAGTFRFDSGAIGTLSSTNTGGLGRYTLVLAGRGLCLEIDGPKRKLTGQIDGEAINYEGEETGYFRQVETFLQAVETGDQSLVPTSYRDAMASLFATLAYNEALRLGRAVTIAEVRA